MKKYIALSEILWRPRLYGLDIQLDYCPDECSIEISEKFTGSKKNQPISTEPCDKWTAFLYKGRIAITSREPIQFELTLSGETGYEYGCEAIKMVSMAYESKKWQTEATWMTEELYDAMPIFLRKEIGSCWIAEQVEECYHGCKHCSLKFAEGGQVYNYDLWKPDDNCTSSISFKVQPVLYIPDVLLDKTCLERRQPLKIVSLLSGTAVQ